MKLITSFVESLRAAAKVNRTLMLAPAAILWTDAERQWECAFSALSQQMPELLSLGEYAPELRSGPAIWLKCAIAQRLADTPLDGVPVIYLPGVSRAELRAIESCPRALQPLAELQYRGVFWSQGNGKDWTLGAFLASKNGGLGLDVAQDKATQEALGQALQAGVLLDCSVQALQGHAINAQWLLDLLAPNPLRDLLQWMNAPEATAQQWRGVLWEVFAKRCNTDFGFDPLADGVLAAAERLAKAQGKWAAVALLYQDAYGSFPQVFALLNQVQPPQLGLFPDPAYIANYPQVNEKSEAALRYALNACAGMDAPQARLVIAAAEKEHGARRDWLWARMKLSPLAQALAHLAEVAERSAQLPIGQTPGELAASYQHSGWQVDWAALQALACTETKADMTAVGGALRALYLPWLQDAANRLQEATKTAGGLPPLGTAAAATAGTCTVFVDGLRYDVAVQLQQRLSALGDTTLSARWSSLPSVTASGKAWSSPVAAHITGSPADTEFAPRVLSDGKPLNGYNLRKLLEEYGVQPLDRNQTGDPQGQAWTEAGDLDHYGHEHGLRLARDLEAQLDQVVERIAELCDAGWKRIRIVTDHGWLLMPGGLPKSELAKHQTETRWGRCAVLKDNAHGTALTFGWDWCQEVQVAYAPGISNFIAGAEYAHGGISLQECLIPVVTLDCADAGQAHAAANITIASVVWKGLRCTIVVEGATPGQRVDIRSKAALASSSLVASVKLIDAGKASLAVADDEHLDAAAVVVVLDADGKVLQKQATTVGEK